MAYSDDLKDPNFAAMMQGLGVEPAQSAPVAPIAPTQNSARARGQELGTANERIANTDQTGQSFIREGEAKVAGAQQKAQAIAQERTHAQEIHERAMARMQNNQALQDQYRRMAEADLSSVKERGMANWGPLLTGIIGAAAGASGNAGLMQGLGMLGNVIERSASAKAQNAAQTFAGHQELARTAMADSANAVDAGTKLMAQEHELAARDLERIAEETSIPVYRETALRLAQGAREDGLKIRQGYYAAEAGRQEALEAKRAAAARPKLSVRDLEAKFAAGTIMPDELKTLQALKAAAAGIDETNEKIRASQNKGSEEKPLGSEEQKMHGLLQGAEGALSRLSETVGGKDASKVDVPSRAWNYVPSLLTPESVEQYNADIDKLLEVKLRGESGGQIGPEEIKFARKGLGLDSSDESIRARGVQSLLSQIEGAKQTYRYKGEPAAEPNKSGAKDVDRLRASLQKYRVK